MTSLATQYFLDLLLVAIVLHDFREHSRVLLHLLLFLEQVLDKSRVSTTATRVGPLVNRDLRVEIELPHNFSAICLQ